MVSFQEELWLSKPLQLSHKPGFESDEFELLNYYRNRIEESEKEREDWLLKYESVRVNQEMNHKAEWEKRARDEEKQELTRQLQERKQALEGGRERLVQLAQENENLRRQQLSNKAKLAKYYDLTEPVQQDVFLSEGERPSNLYTFSASKKSDGLKPKHVIRTLHLPSNFNSSLSQEKEALLQQIATQREIFKGKIRDAKEAKRFREDSIRQQFEDDGKAINELIKRITQAQKGKISTIRDIFRLKHESQGREREMVENIGSLTIHCDTVVQEAVRGARENAMRKTDAEKCAKKLASDYAEQLREQAFDSKEQLELVRDQHSHLQAIYRDKINELEERCHLFRKKYEELQTRSNLEIEGYKNDIAMLNSKIYRIRNPSNNYPKPSPPKKEEDPLCQRCYKRRFKE